MVFYILSASCLHGMCPEDVSLGIKSQKSQPHPIGAFSRTHPLTSESSICGFSYTKWFVTPAFYKYYVPKTIIL